MVATCTRARETPVNAFDFGWHRSDVRVVTRSKANIDMALETNVMVYVMDAPMEVVVIGDAILQLSEVRPQHFLTEGLLLEK